MSDAERYIEELAKEIADTLTKFSFFGSKADQSEIDEVKRVLRERLLPVLELPKKWRNWKHWKQYTEDERCTEYICADELTAALAAIAKEKATREKRP
jgi:hypothetical protein